MRARTAIRSARRPGRRAFTLTETLIVTGLLAVLASVVVPSLRSSRTQTLEAVARTVAADLRLARSLAIQYNTEYTVRLSPGTNSYELVHTGSASPPPLRDPQAPAGQPAGAYRVDLSRAGVTTRRNGSVALAGAALKTSRTAATDVAFGPLGGTGPARNEDTVVWLTSGHGAEVRYVRLTVSWITGQVWIDSAQMFDPNNAGQLFQ